MSNIGYYTAASGVISYQYAMDVTANNLANVNTFGFKASRPSFADLIYTERNNDNTETQFGHGVRVQKTDMMFEQSQLRETGSLSTLRLWTRASLRYSLPKIWSPTLRMARS